MRATSAAVTLVSVGVLLGACAKKEEPPPAAQAPATTTPTTTTTLAPASPTPAPTPPPVWRTTHWGMTSAEVLAALPQEAQKLPKPAPFTQPQPGSSLVAGTGDLAIPAYEADGSTFQVLFGFDKDALNRVHLKVPKPAAETCVTLEKALTDRHGQPARRGSFTGSLKGNETVWTLPDQTVVLSCAGVFSLGFLSASLDYQPPGAAPPVAP
jgi:hypothetical protein